MGASVFFESASELARLSNTFLVDEVATDPTTVTLTLTDPTGLSTPYTWAGGTVTRDSVGTFHKDVTCSVAGTWQYTWVGTGAATDTASGTFVVQEAAIGRLYATVDALKSRLGITDVRDDFELHAACFAASRAIESHTGRIYWRSAPATARTFEATSSTCLRVPPYCDIVSVSELATGTGDGTFPTVWSASDYQLLPTNPQAAPEPKPYEEIRAISRTFPVAYSGRRDLVRVTGVFGWPSIPWGIRQAALILAQETFKAKDTFGGVAGFGEFGVVRLRENPLLGSYVDPFTRMDGYG